jgi:hypothetical protein
MPLIYFKIPPREWLFDEKLNALGLEYKGAWINLLALARLCNCNGKFLDEVDDPYTDSEITKKSKIGIIHFNKFIVAGMISKQSSDGKIIFSVKNWLKYQPEWDRTKVYSKSYKDLNIKKEKEPTHTDYTILAKLHPEKCSKPTPKGKYDHLIIRSRETTPQMQSQSIPSPKQSVDDQKYEIERLQVQIDNPSTSDYMRDMYQKRLLFLKSQDLE